MHSSGTGGDEASLFASELQKAYEKTAKRMNWEYDILDESVTDLGGIKEAVISINGRASMGGTMNFDMDEERSILNGLGPYGLFKYERCVFIAKIHPSSSLNNEISSIIFNLFRYVLQRRFPMSNAVYNTI